MVLVRVTEQQIRKALVFNFLYIVLDILAFACSVGFKCQDYSHIFQGDECHSNISLCLKTDV